MNTRAVRRFVLAVVGIALVLGAVALANRSVAYVTTQGSSMSPRFRSGDLAIVTRSSSYGVGDIAAYRSDLLEAVVLHRIVDRDGNQYVLKGDSNSWQDSERPTEEDLIGKLLLRVPAGGRALAWLAASWPFAAAAVVVASAGIGTSRRRTRRQGQPMKLSSNPPRPAGYRRAHTARTVAHGCLAGLVAFLALAAVAFTRPVTRGSTIEVPYVQRGSFEYTTRTVPNAAYPDGIVDTGETVFVGLVPSLDLRFTHRLETDSSRTIEGTITLRARVDNGTGWRRTVDLAPPVALADGTATAMATLNIPMVRTLVDDLERTTGVHSAAQTLDVIAHVRLHGSVGGQRVDDTFAPELPFRLEALQLRPAWTDTESGRDDPLHPRMEEAVHTTRTEPRHINILGVEPSMLDLRRIAVAGIALSAIASLATSAWTRRRRRTEPGVIAAKYGDRIIPVAAAERDAHHAVIDVVCIDDLAKLASQYECLILHETDDSCDRYLFQVDRTVYRYISGRDAVEVAPPVTTGSNGRH